MSDAEGEAVRETTPLLPPPASAMEDPPLPSAASHDAILAIPAAAAEAPPLTRTRAGVRVATLMYAGLASVLFFVFLSTTTAFVLADWIYVADPGAAAGTLGLADEAVALPAVVAFAVVSDRVGRRVVYAAGFVCIAAGLLGYTLATALYPGLLVARLVFAVGGAACSSMMTAVLSDQVVQHATPDEEEEEGADGGNGDRGVRRRWSGSLAGGLGVASGVGAVVAALGLARLPAVLAPHVPDAATSLRVTYDLVAGLALVTAVLVFLGLGAQQRRHPPRDRTCRRWVTGAWHGIRAAGPDATIRLSYAAGFVVRPELLSTPTCP